MKLLSKAEVAKAKTSQKKVEIEEGMKIARNVDALRKKSAEEQKNYSLYKEESVKELNSQIIEKQKIIEELDTDIRIKTAIRDELNKPLIEEWNKLDAYKAGLVMREQDLDKETARVNLLAIQLNTDKSLLNYERAIFESDKIVLERDKDIVKAQMGEYNSLVQAQRDSTQNIKFYEVKVVKAIEDREVAVAVREKEAKVQEEYNNKVARQHDDERVQLNDMRATLERAIKRTKK